MISPNGSLVSWLIHHVYVEGEITSITNLAIRHGLQPNSVWIAACLAQRNGKILIARNGRHPATLRPNPNYRPPEENGKFYQLPLWKRTGEGIPERRKS